MPLGRCPVTSAHSGCVIIDSTPRFCSRCASDSTAFVVPSSESVLVRIQSLHIFFDNGAHVRFRFFVEALNEKASRCRLTTGALDQ
ncbi:MAG: hypothetical protein BGN87_18540 [Rhizobiales bacterium 65-79]|nr:MAG: hypothetical protein BGN87_18540 [Rhizobiales bacterium 65-79]